MSATQSTSRPSGGGDDDFLQRIVPLVRRGGLRNAVELAKSFDIPAETVRYRIKKMLSRGLKVHASVDYNKFGLAYYYAYFALSDRALAVEKNFFDTLADGGYLTQVSKMLPSGEYWCKFAIPSGQPPGSLALSRMLRGLREEGYIEDFRINSISWERAHMIQAQHFDLKHSAWRIDWSKLRRDLRGRETAKEKRADRNRNRSSPASHSQPLIHQPPASQGVVKYSYDQMDLNILRELELDALVKLSEIAAKFDTVLNNVFYHYHKHILDGKLLDEYVIRWVGTQTLSSLLAQITFSNLTFEEESFLQDFLPGMPFVWVDAHSVESGDYVCEALIPVDEYMNLMNYLSNSLWEIALKLRVNLLDARSRRFFALPGQMFQDNQWKYDPEGVVQRISGLNSA